MDLNKLKERKAAIEAQIKELKQEERSLFSKFISQKFEEGWTRLCIGDNGGYGEIYCYGSDILVSSKAYELFFPFLMKENNMESIEEAQEWFSQHEDEPEYVAYPLREFKDFLEKNHPDKIIDLDDI